VWGGEICQLSIFAKLVCETVGGQFFLFCQNYMDVKLVCQIVGIALIKKVLFTYNPLKLRKVAQYHP
jgi:hypothetical protein